MDFSVNVHDQTLFSLATWASFAVQIIGYFPLSSKYASESISNIGNRNSKTFKFTWTGSINPYYSLLLIAASFTWSLVYFLRYQEFHSFTDLRAATEVAAYNLMIITTTLTGLYVKIFALTRGKQYQKFWEQTQSLLAYFPDASDFQKIKTSCRTDVILMLIPIVAHITYFHISLLLTSIVDDWASWTKTVTQLNIGLAFWSIFAFLHVGNGIWMNFFVKLYTKCFLSIANDLKSLTREKSNDPESKDLQNDDLSKLYDDFNKKSENKPQVNYSTELRRALEKLALVDHEIIRFNKFFGNMILLQVGNCVMNLLVFLFFACLWMGRGQWNAFAETIVPAYLYGKELLDMGTVAERLTTASEAVLNAVVEDLELGILSEEMFLKVQITIIQLCTKPPIISARHFFTVNRSLVTSVMSALATFLVVLVQFRDQDDEEAKHDSATSKITTLLKSNMSSLLTTATKGT